MRVETALLFETIEQIYARIFRTFRPRTPTPQITVRFRKYATPNSHIRLHAGHMTVEVSDLLEGAPAPVQEALACILVSKLFRRAPERAMVARYNCYLNRADVRRTVHLVKQQRGHKRFRDPVGRVFDLRAIFEELNCKYFYGLMARPQLGWSVGPSRTTLGHYDASHHVIVLSSLLDSRSAPELVVKFVMFHEMLHLRFPTQYRGPRRCVHTSEFKEAERRFEDYSRAKAELQRFLNSSESVRP